MKMVRQFLIHYCLENIQLKVQAPGGYMLLKEPITVEVGSSVHKITIENQKSQWEIPKTGGIGTGIFYSIGGILMLLVVFLYVRNKRNK